MQLDMSNPIAGAVTIRAASRRYRRLEVALGAEDQLRRTRRHALIPAVIDEIATRMG